MEFRGITLRCSVIAVILMCMPVAAQGRDTQELIAIERAFCEHANPGHEEAADMEKYLHAGPLNN
jgi:hypothetical protein